eukprot:m.318301 g.318301  ORF g.318301 m.318301 type:complete len:187 (+) comp20288_c0_seq4:290-850(+)
MCVSLAFSLLLCCCILVSISPVCPYGMQGHSLTVRDCDGAYQDLKSKRIKGYTFDWGRMLQAEGDTGPFVQYTHARLKSIERVTGTHINSTCDLTPLVSSPEAAAVISWLSREDEVLEQSLADMEPAHVVHYLFKLCRLVSRALPSLRVKDMPTHIAEPRMLLFHCSRQSIARCLQILGLPPLEQV